MLLNGLQQRDEALIQVDHLVFIGRFWLAVVIGELPVRPENVGRVGNHHVGEDELGTGQSRQVGQLIEIEQDHIAVNEARVVKIGLKELGQLLHPIGQQAAGGGVDQHQLKIVQPGVNL